MKKIKMKVTTRQTKWGKLIEENPLAILALASVPNVKIASLSGKGFKTKYLYLHDILG